MCVCAPHLLLLLVAVVSWRRERDEALENGVTYSISAFLSCCINKVLRAPASPSPKFGRIRDDESLRFDCRQCRNLRPVFPTGLSRPRSTILVSGDVWCDYDCHSLLAISISTGEERRRRRKRNAEMGRNDARNFSFLLFRDALSRWNGLVTVARISYSSNGWVSPVSQHSPFISKRPSHLDCTFSKTNE